MSCETVKIGWGNADIGLEIVQTVEEAGFDSLWYGDHFFPWHHTDNAKAIFPWSVMPVAAERTKKTSIGVCVTTPIGGRYHPAIIAQACGTLDRMYPGRILLGVGTGEAINESQFMKWPPWRERMDRLVEAVQLMRKLWTSTKYFKHDGRYFRMDRAFLYEKPTRHVPIYFAASGKKSARYAGKYGDNLLLVSTLNIPNNSIFEIFEESARKAGKNPAKMEKAVVILGAIGKVEKLINKIRRLDAGIWLPGVINEPDPRNVSRIAHKRTTDDAIRAHYSIGSKTEEIIEDFDKWKRAGANHLIFADFGDDPKTTIKEFREKIIPNFRE